jgi:hypothetical protein
MSLFVPHNMVRAADGRSCLQQATSVAAKPVEPPVPYRQVKAGDVGVDAPSKTTRTAGISSAWSIPP